MNKLLKNNLTMKQFNNESGQIIIILLLLMLIALSVGLAITQRSVTSVTTSTQTEQATRAFSAAEAGIEKVIQSGSAQSLNISLGNDSTAAVTSTGLIPNATTPAATGIEYPPIGRETTAQIWLADPGITGLDFDKNTFDLYFGNESTTDKPAVEVAIIIKTVTGGVTSYTSKRYYYDSDSVRTSGPSSNQFTHINNCNSHPATTILSGNSRFYCRQQIGPVTDPTVDSNPPPCLTPSCQLIMVRIRYIYSTDNHKLAIVPNGAGGKLPPQVEILNSTGTSGQSQKKLRVFRVKDVVPPWFDFAIFSVNEIKK